MADYKVTDTEMISVANAIRTKGGTSAQLEWPTGFANAVAAIPSGITPTGTISITENGTIDVTNYENANVNVSGGGGNSGFTRINPLHENVGNAWVSNGYWHTTNAGNSLNDIYQIEANKRYYLMLDATPGNRFRAAFFTSDPAQFTDETAGDYFAEDISNPSEYTIKGRRSGGSYAGNTVPIIKNIDGYIAVMKCSDGSAVKTYLFRIDF